MYRRVVSLMLLPGVLLTQSAALGHAHGGGQPAGHDLRSHFHTQLVSAGSGHSENHHHGLGGHHHHGYDAQEPQTPATPEPQPDHDSDAVYVASVDAVPAERCVVHDGAGVPLPWAILAPRHLSEWCPTLSLHAANWWHPPPSGHTCPLYVRHLTLLI